MPDFDPLGFPSSYTCEVNPEFPGGGDWGAPVYSFWRDGPRDEAFRSAWGTPLVVRVRHDEGATWVSQVEAGSGNLSGAFGCPDPNALCIVAGGESYLVDSRSPERYRPLLGGVRAVRHFAGLDLLLLATPLELAAVGPEGLRWHTGRLCLDDLRLSSAWETLTSWTSA
jgi:hypothetical protein